jgi:uncharacterized protein YbjT (DUF2867 family)
MKITIFGATGRIARLAAEQALASGDQITAVVRDPARLDLSPHPALEVVTVAGLTDPAPLIAALRGSDAALSGVGPRGRKDVTVASTATRGILAALQASGVSRFAAVSAVPVGPVPEGESALNRYLVLPLVSYLLRGIYADLAVMEQEIKRSPLEWTIVRPPRLFDRPLTGNYKMAIGGNVPRGKSLARAEVAHAMLAVLRDPRTIRQAVGVAG